MALRPIILEMMRQVASEQDRELAPLSDDLRLASSGLDSLCIAVLVAKLEDELGVDPFNGEMATFPTTVGDFIKLYDQAKPG